jgi:hypothetical protein
VGRRVSCPKCSTQFEAAAPTDLTASPAPEAIAPAPARDPLPQAATAGDAHYLTEHPKARQRRMFADDEGGDHPPAQFLDRGLPGRKRANAAMILLGMSMIVDAASIGVEGLHHRLAEAEIRGIKVDQAQETLYDALELALGASEVVVTIATGVVFCVWTYRAYKNLRLLGVRGLKHSPGWVVGYFFIPILNLFRPCAVFLEMWKASDPDAPLDDAYAWQHRSGGVLVGWWWACYLISGVISYVSFRVSILSLNPTLDQLNTQFTFATLASGTSIVAALLAILVVKRIQDRETETYRRLGEAEAAYFKNRPMDEGR